MHPFEEKKKGAEAYWGLQVCYADGNCLPNW